MAAGRPSDYSVETTLSLCEAIATGRSLRSVCLQDDMPAISSVYRWLNAHAEFREQYARAKEDSADALADDILHIADTPMVGIKTETSPSGVKTVEGDMIEHRRLQVDARKWIASKLKPRKYGDKIELGGPDGGAIALQISSVDSRL